MAWRNNVRHVQDGEAVAAGVDGRPTRDLAGQTEYLRSRIDGAELGEAVFAYDVSLDPAVLIGQPVYYNTTRARFEQALAGVETDSTTGTLVATTASDVLGVVYAKTNSSLGDVLLNGRATLDISAAVDGSVTAGRYYLSSAERGKLVRQRPPVTVAVLYADGAGKVYVQPQMRDFLEDHIHYAFTLEARPAGSTVPPENGERHTITDADADRKGWLPADHASFHSTAPPRAVFGYNLAQHPELQAVWPPIPVEAAALLWDKGESGVGGTDVPLGQDGLVVIDANGIWWMSDCYGDVPWPTTLNTSVSSSASSSSALPECPRQEQMRLVLHYARATFATDHSVVTSLTAGSGITLRDADGNAATRGALTISASGVSASALPDEAPDILPLDIPAEPEAAGPTELDGQITGLHGAVEGTWEGVVYLGLPRGAHLTGRLRIPSASDQLRRLRLRFRLLALATGTLPPLTLAYRVLPRAVDPVHVPVRDDGDALVNFARSACLAGQYVDIDVDGPRVGPGDTVLFQLLRETQDNYPGTVGLLDLLGLLA